MLKDFAKSVLVVWANPLESRIEQYNSITIPASGTSASDEMKVPSAGS